MTRSRVHSIAAKIGIMPTVCTPSCSYSRLAGDADLAELIALFVAELPHRLALMQVAADRQDWPALGTLAHQLKGAGGSHGFDGLTPLAYRLERAARSFSTVDEIRAALAALSEGCASLRAGRPK
jgi:HPt (histidine-containing phosphotransfer) domain-containing protein